MTTPKILFLSLSLAVSASLSALPVAGIPLDDCLVKSAKWHFSEGGEFPGASGSLAANDGQGLLLSYDFSKGGSYVAAIRDLEIQGVPAEFTFLVKSAEASSCFFRLIDSTGRCFQSELMPIAAGKDDSLTLRVDSKWRGAWGGDGKSGKPKPPFSSMAFCVEKDAALPLKGSILLKAISLAGDDISIGKFKGEGVSFESAGWKLDGKWLGSADSPVLMLKAVPSGLARPATLSAAMQTEGRPQSQYLSLDPKSGAASLVFEPALLSGGSPFNVYSVTVSLKSGDQFSSAVCRLRGLDSDKVNLGAAKDSLQIKSLPFGTCTHFSYGQSGAFSVWRDNRRLLDMISACGYKWVRDGVYVEKSSDGSYKVRECDLDWVRYAKAKGISTIAVVENFKADTPVEELCAEASALCLGTKGLVDVFELGNEPNNFGGWIKKYGGTWNGKEKDNSTSQWVHEHLKATNAVAKAMKAVRPDATLIGTGACPPTNFRYLDIGVADELDGIVEHPYSFAMPPEMVPWSLRLESRDGVKIGDNEGSFAGLVESYFKKFEQIGGKRSLWVTEFGFTTFRFNGKNEKGLYAGYTEDAQAVYLVRRFILSLTLPIKVSCQYDFVDDYGSNPNTDEANFGIIRGDFSPKPSYYAIQRMNSLFDSVQLDPSASVKVEKSDLHRAMVRGELIKDWDKVEMKASNSVLAFPFVCPDSNGGRMLAIWSTQPYQREFNCRAASISVKGWDSFNSSPAIGIDIMTGATFDVPFTVKDGELLLDNIQLSSNPIVVKFIKR